MAVTFSYCRQASGVFLVRVLSFLRSTQRADGLYNTLRLARRRCGSCCFHSCAARSTQASQALLVRHVASCKAPSWVALLSSCVVHTARSTQTTGPSCTTRCVVHGAVVGRVAFTLLATCAQHAARRRPTVCITYDARCVVFW